MKKPGIEIPAVREKKERIITLNKKAFHDYEIFNKYEAGMVLLGSEVKMLRQQKGTIQDSYARIKNGEIWLVNSNIPEYKYSTFTKHDPLRERKLLLNRSEIKKITTKLQDKGFTLIPLKMYFLGANIKLEVALAKGKRQYDKREAIRKEESKRRLKRIRQAY